MTDEERQDCRSKCNKYQIYLCELCGERPKCIGLALKAVSKRLREINEDKEKNNETLEV